MCLYRGKQTIPDVVLDSPSKVVATFIEIVQDERSTNPYFEIGILFLMNARNHLVGIRTFEGSVDHASVYPREAAYAAMTYGATSAVFVHNHPSGYPEPSPQDIALTRRLFEALGTIDVTLHDHIVIETGTPNRLFSSMRELGLMSYVLKTK
jgi:DNA repair protein RadC